MANQVTKRREEVFAKLERLQEKRAALDAQFERQAAREAGGGGGDGGAVVSEEVRWAAGRWFFAAVDYGLLQRMITCYAWYPFCTLRCWELCFSGDVAGSNVLYSSNASMLHAELAHCRHITAKPPAALTSE